MWQIAENFTVKLGGIHFRNVSQLVTFKGAPLFNLRRHDSNGQLGIDFELFDSEGLHLASVKGSQTYPVWEKLNRDQYGIVGSDTHIFFLNYLAGTALCEIHRGNAGSTQLDVFMKLYLPNKVLFQATPDRANLGNNVPGNVMTTNAAVGIGIA